MRTTAVWLAVIAASGLVGCGGGRLQAFEQGGVVQVPGPEGAVEVRVVGEPVQAMPTIVLPGQDDSAEAWIARHLQGPRPRTGHAVVVSPRGLGGSASPSAGGFEPHRQAEDVLAVLDALGGQRAQILAFGHSATVALAFAQRWPERFESLVVVHGRPDWRDWAPGWPWGTRGRAIRADYQHWTGRRWPAGGGVVIRADYREVARRLGRLVVYGDGPAANRWPGAVVKPYADLEVTRVLVERQINAEERLAATVDLEVGRDGVPAANRGAR